MFRVARIDLFQCEGETMSTHNDAQQALARARARRQGNPRPQPAAGQPPANPQGAPPAPPPADTATPPTQQDRGKQVRLTIITGIALFLFVVTVWVVAANWDGITSHFQPATGYNKE